MPNEQLVGYIRGEFARGVEKTTIIQSLIGSGWKVEDINMALDAVNPVINPFPTIPSVPKAPTAPAQPVYSAPTMQQSPSVKTVVQDIAAGLFIMCVVILTAISVLGVWDVFSGDVIGKSFETLGLLAFASVIVIVASRYVGDPASAAEPAMPNPTFHAIRNVTVGTLIASATLLALVGILAIWNIISYTGVINKSLSSLAILAFSSLIIVVVSLEREQIPSKKKAA